MARLVEHRGVDRRERPRGRAGLERRHARERGDHDHPGLGLPPRVDDRRVAQAHVLAVPHPRLGVDRLADRAEQAQRRQVVAGRVLGSPLHVGADRGRRGVQDVDAVALDDLPPALRVRVVRNALVDHPGRAVAERAVHDVAVAGHPADIGGAPVHRVGLHVEDVVVRGRHADEVPGGRVDDALRPRRGARGVQQEEQILGIHRLAGAGRRVVRLALGELVPPAVAPGEHVDLATGASKHDGLANPAASREGLIGVPLEGHAATAAPGLVLRDQDLALHVVHAIGEGLCREPSEDDRVRRPEPRTRQHGDRQLGDHAHVDGDGRALVHAHAP